MINGPKNRGRTNLAIINRVDSMFLIDGLSATTAFDSKMVIRYVQGSGTDIASMSNELHLELQAKTSKLRRVRVSPLPLFTPRERARRHAGE